MGKHHMGTNFWNESAKLEDWYNKDSTADYTGDAWNTTLKEKHAINPRSTHVFHQTSMDNVYTLPTQKSTQADSHVVHYLDPRGV